MLYNIYRISDNGNIKGKLPISKLDCLKNFIEVFGKENLYVFADNCKDETIQVMEKMGVKPYILSLGNSKSIRYVIDFAIQNFTNKDYIYLVEDDYLHIANAQQILMEGLAIADYVTLYDHPDKYENNNNKSKILHTSSAHWREIFSTTMTFAAQIETIKKDYKLIQIFTKSKIPSDYYLFSVLTFYPFINKNKESFRNYIFLRMYRLLLLRIPFFNKKRKLISCLPGYATHIEEKYLSPVRNWNQYEY